MNDDRDFAKKITTYLDRGVSELKAGTAYKLQLARKAALDRLVDPARQASTQWALAGAGTSTVGGGRGYRFGAGLGLALLLAIGGAFGTSRRRTPRSCPQTCRSMHTWTGDSRLG